MGRFVVAIVLLLSLSALRAGAGSLITKDKAIETARQDVTAVGGGQMKSPTAELSMNNSMLTYEVRFIYSANNHKYVYHIDAATGKVLDHKDLGAAAGKTR